MAEQRMSAQLTRLAKKRGRLPALVTALGFVALVLIQNFLSSLAGWIGSSLYERVSFGSASFEWTPWQPGYLLETFLKSSLPFAVGVFVSLWLIAPLAAELTVRFVVTRALLASAAGSVLVVVVTLFIDLVGLIAHGFELHSFAHSGIFAIGRGVDAFIYSTPVVVLAAVLLWLWLRAHPRDYAVVGLIDEL